MEFKNKVKYAIEDFRKYIDDEDYEFAYATIDFLSNRPNSHKHVYSEEVIKEYANTVLGKWVIGEYIDATDDMSTHVDNQVIQGVVPPNQEVKYRYDIDGYLVASVDVVLSKLYANAYKVLREDSENKRSVSIEELIGFTPETASYVDGTSDKIVTGFNICGITVLGKPFNPSVPNANIKLTQMSEDNIGVIEMEYAKYAEIKEENIISHPFDGSKKSLDESDWDGDSAKDDLLKEKNFETLAPKVCMLLTEGWKDRKKGSLKYPVANLKDGKWVYNAEGISSALGYARQNEPSIVSKIEKIWKKMGLDSEEKMAQIMEKLSNIENKLNKEDKMAKELNITKCAISIGDDLWCKINNLLVEKYPKDMDGWTSSQYWVKGIYEEGNEKFVIIEDREDGKLYKLMFVYTEEELSLSEEMTEVTIDFVEKNKMQLISSEEISEYEDKIKEEDKEVPKEDEEEKMGCGTADEEKMSDEQISEMVSKLAELESEIIELREFKESTLNAKRDSVVLTTMASIKDYIDKETFNKYQESGNACKYEDINGWKNEVLASISEKALSKLSQKEDGIMDMGVIGLSNRKEKTGYNKYL